MAALSPLSAEPLRIREATSEDAEAIADIYAPFVRDTAVTFELQAPDAAEIAERMRRVQGPGLPYLVADFGGELVGYAYATPFRPRAGYRFTVEDTVYVRMGFEGRGMGRSLLAELMVRCRVAGLKQMLAVIGGENPASVGLHRGAGFVDVGVLREVGFKLGKPQDVTLMQRAL